MVDSRNDYDCPLDNLVEWAEDGDILAAQQLLGRAANHLRNGELVPEPLASYLASAFDNLSAPGVSAIDASAALNLKQGRGRNKHRQERQHMRICVEVQLAYLDVGRYESSDGPGAYEIVADKYGYKDEGSVRRVFSQHHKEFFIKASPREILEEVLKLIKAAEDSGAL